MLQKALSWMVLENSIHGTDFKRGARSCRAFPVSLVECEESFYLLLFWYLFVAEELPFGCSWQLSSAVEPCSNSVHPLNGNKPSSSRFHVVPRISFGCCGRFTAAELLSFSLSVMLVLIWVLTGHWLLMDGEYVNKGILLLLFACSVTSVTW